ncbi:EamA family transporter [Candidatus Woesearchaeota archaeon]|nr:EamA family transporter [Candidatus Woesearchaeota archaeon]
MSWVLFALLSAMFFSLRDILSKHMLKRHDSIVILFNAAFLVTLLTAIIFYNSISFVLPGKILGVLFVKSVLVALGWYFLLEAYKHLDISTAAPLLNLSSIILLVLGIVFLGETLDGLQVVGFIVLILGAYALELKSLNNFWEPISLFKQKSVIFIFLSLLSLSFSAVLDKILSWQILPQTIIFYNGFVIALIAFIVILAKRDIPDFVSVLRESPWHVLFMGVANILSDVTYFLAVVTPGALITLIIPLKRLSTVFTTMAGGHLFKEERIFYKGVISLFMVGGVLLLVL